MAHSSASFGLRLGAVRRLTECSQSFVRVFGRPFRLDLYASFSAGSVLAKAAPLPVPPNHRIVLASPRQTNVKGLAHFLLLVLGACSGTRLESIAWLYLLHGDLAGFVHNSDCWQLCEFGNFRGDLACDFSVTK
jgi:hypothetical protein